MLPGLAQAQIARDIGMAQAMLPHLGRGAVLLAGNGHVRSDIGVPYWLRRAMAPSTMAPGSATDAVQVRAVSYVESADATAPARFDQTVVVPPVTRPDPCATLKMPTR